MIIKINDERRYEQSTLYTSYLEENNTTTLEFEFPEYLEKYNKKANFELKDGTKVCKLFNEITSNKLTLTRDLLKFNKLQMAIEFFDTNEDLIYRTSILTIRISDSIICDDDVSPEDSKVVILNELIQKVNDLNTEVTENESVRESNEETRVANENTRINNEKAREEYIKGLKKDVELGNLDGATFTPSVSENGDLSWTNNKGLENPETVNIKGEKGDKGEKGEQGSPFRIVKTYPSVEAMQADFDNMNVGDYVMITSSIELEDNAKLYCKTETEWVYITDFSGATGIQGEKGEKGDKGKKGEQGEPGVGISKLEVIDGALYVTLTNNVKENAGLILTDEVKSWLVSQITDNAESDFNTYYDSKVTEFNSNATEKTTAYNDNAEDKLNEYNTNATNKINEYNSNAEAILKLLPSKTTEIAEVIDVDDSAESSFNKLSIFGNSEQKSTTGAAKVDFGAFAGDYSDEQMEIKIDENGIISLKGTVSAYYSKKIGTITKDMFSAGNNIYYVRGNNTNNGLIFLQAIGSISFSSNNNSPSFEITDESQESDLYIVVNYLESGTLNVNEILYPMISLESNALYEPYTGGNPSPNPDYPQEIECIKDSITFKRIGKNYIPFPYQSQDMTLFGVDFKINSDGSIVATGTSTNESCDFYLFGSNTDNNNYLIFRKDDYKLSKIENTGIIFIAREKSLGTLIGNSAIENALKNQDCYFYGLLVRVKKNTVANDVIYPQIEKGTEATEYEPYNEDIYTINLNTDLNSINILSKQLEYNYVDEDGNKYLCDVIDFKNKKIIKYLNKIILPKENITWTQNKDETDFFEIANYTILSDYQAKGDLAISNYFRDDRYKSNYIVTSKSTVFIRFSKSSGIDTLQKAQEFMDTHDVEVLYVLANPKEIALTDEELSYLEQFPLEKGINHIYSDDELSPKFKLMYYQDINILLDKINKNIADVSAQLIEGGSNV